MAFSEFLWISVGLYPVADNPEVARSVEGNDVF